MVHIQLEEIEKYAIENNVPIMQKDGIEFLTKYIKENNIKKILEIGSAIGYSAIKMALVDDNIKVTTIERDIERYNIAVKNINDFNLNDYLFAKLSKTSTYLVTLFGNSDVDLVSKNYSHFLSKLTGRLTRFFFKDIREI